MVVNLPEEQCAFETQLGEIWELRLPYVSTKLTNCKNYKIAN